MLAPEERRPRIPLATIDAAVSARLGTTRVTGNAQPAVLNRQVAMYLAKHVGGWSTTRIGKFYNGRDHSTVCYAVKRIDALREAEPEVDALLTNLTDEIRCAPIRPPTIRKALQLKSGGIQFANGSEDHFLDALADRIVERLRSRGLKCAIETE
jgi:Bacterial dnaA protein helix-turn-helix